MVMRVLVDVRLPPEAESASMARRALEDLPDRFSAPREMLQLAVSELVTNAVVHADLDATEEIGLIVRVGDDRVRVEVTDPGHGREAAVAGWDSIPEDFPADSPSEGNFGLFVVRSIADRSGVLWDGGITAWFEVDAPT